MKETESLSESLPLILLTGDNPRTSHLLHRALLEEGFQVQLAPSYTQLESLWHQERPGKKRNARPPSCCWKSQARMRWSAVEAALKLKRQILCCSSAIWPTLSSTPADSPETYLSPHQRTTRQTLRRHFLTHD